jgi:SAM-dependent methyltransferase
MTQQNWGFTGPAAVTHFLQETGEIEHAQPVAVFYPISFKDRNQMIISRHKPEENITDDTRGVHFWARRMKPRLEEKENNTPRRGSFMDKLLDKHGVNPGAAPIPAKTTKNHPQADEPDFREMIAASALAGEQSIDQLSRKYLVEKKFIKDCMREFPIGSIATHPTGEQFQMPDASKFDYSMFDDQDLLNFILQRSEILVDEPKRGRLIKEWSNGSTTRLDAIIAKEGVILAERATRIIGAEFDQLMPVLQTIPNKSIADIGCGYAIFELFMYKAFQSRLVLIDLEENDQRQFGYSNEGSAYSKLSTAVEFLKKNDVSSSLIERLNPSKDDIMSVDPVDIAVSFLACGFHFPVDVYLEFFEQKVKSGGHIFLDLRRGSFDEQAKKLERIGELTVLQEIGKQTRVMVKRA